MIKKRRSYDKTFKREAVNLCLHSEKSVAEIAADLGVAKDLLYQWRRKLEADENEPDINYDQRKEYDQLKKELAETRLERDILKKALGIFSKTSK